jgi:hypothetical protein
MNTGRRIFIGALALIAFLAAFLTEEHYRGKWALEGWVREMEAKGEKFGIEDLIVPPPAAEDNSFFDLLQANSQLRAIPQVTSMMPPDRRLVLPGKFVLTSTLTEWEGSQFVSGRSKTISVNWKSFAEEVQKIAEPLSEVREALKKPAFDANLNYRLGLNMLLPHLAGIKGIAVTQSAATLNELHANHLEAALEDLEALIALSRCLKDERLVISQLVRNSISTIAFGTTWQALHTPGWSDSQLARLQAAWRPLDFVGDVGRSVEMERAQFLLTFERSRQSEKEVSAMLATYGSGFNPGTAAAAPLSSPVEVMDYAIENFPDLCRKVIYIPAWQFAWARHDELNYLKRMQALIESARRAGAEKSRLAITTKLGQDEEVIFDTSAVQEKVEKERTKMNFYDRMRFLFSPMAETSLSRSVDRALQCATQRELIVAAIAVKRYELHHGEPPPNLAALVPEILLELPRDFMNGQRLHYRLSADGSFLLYSVGTDGRDDGGDPNPPPTVRTVTHRLWDGRDIVWPKPATLEEIAAAESKFSRKQVK